MWWIGKDGKNAVSQNLLGRAGESQFNSKMHSQFTNRDSNSELTEYKLQAAFSLFCIGYNLNWCHFRCTCFP
jgi:hypothetical protein